MDQDSDDNHDAELNDSREEVPIENKCELCGKEFVTSNSLKIHGRKCVKKHKKLQQNRQITPEIVKSAAPDVQAAKVNTTKLRAQVVVQAEPHEPLTKTRTSPQFRVTDEVEEEETKGQLNSE